MSRFRSVLALAAALLLVALLALLLRRRGEPPTPAPVPDAGAVAGAGEAAAPVAPPAGAGGRRTLMADLAGDVPADAILLEVRTAEGDPLPGAAVTLVRVEPFHELGLTRDAVLASGLRAGDDGRHLFRDLEPGERYRAAATAPGFGMVRSPATAPGERLELRLGPSLVVSGTVVREGGGVVAEAEVQLLALQTSSFLAPQIATTGADGAFLFEVSEPGLYRLQVTSSAGQDVVRDLEVDPDLGPLRIVVGGEPSLTLRLRDDTGTAVAGALVELEPLARGHTPRRGRTGEDGSLSFYSLPAGYWNLRIRAEGLARHQERWLYRPPGHQVLERTLGRPGALAVQVRDGAGRPVPGFAVRLRPAAQGGPPLPEARTGESGVARWQDLAAGDYLVTAPGGRAGGQTGLAVEEQALEGGQARVPSSVWATVQAGTTAEVELILDGHARPTIQVLEQGRPVAGARVDLVRGAPGVGGRRGPAAASAVTDPQGRALLAPVSPGPWQVVVTPGANRAPCRATVDLPPGTPEEVVELPSGSLAGQVLGPEGPVAGALVRLLGSAGPGTWSGVRSGPDGRWEIGGVAAGRWRLEIRAAGHLPWTSEELELDGLSRVDVGAVSLEAAGVLEGTVRGMPPPEPGTMAIRLAELVDAAGRTVATSGVDSSGGYRFPAVPPGSYVLVIRSGDRVWRSPPVDVGPGTRRFDFPVEDG